jgi:hypothetical protein
VVHILGLLAHFPDWQAQFRCLERWPNSRSCRAIRVSYDSVRGARGSSNRRLRSCRVPPSVAIAPLIQRSPSPTKRLSDEITAACAVSPRVLSAIAPLGVRSRPSLYGFESRYAPFYPTCPRGFPPCCPLRPPLPPPLPQAQPIGAARLSVANPAEQQNTESQGRQPN